MHHAKNVAKSIISDSKTVLCIKCMLYHKIVSCTYFWYIINLSIDILCFILYRLNKRNCDKNDCDCKMREFSRVDPRIGHQCLCKCRRLTA